MSELYNRIEALCKKAGLTVTEMCRQAGVSRGNLTDLKMGRQSGLSAKNLDKIASFFGVSVSYLLGTEKDKASAKAEADDEVSEMLEEIRRRPDLRVLFSLSKNATPEDIRKAIKIIKAICGDDNGGYNN